MQFTTAVLAVLATATTALASPTPGGNPGECTFGQYACARDGYSIKQCDISGKWVEVGPCAEGELCRDSPDNGLPYCFTATTNEKRAGGYPWCATPGQYSCTPDRSGIAVCNAQNQLVFNGACLDGSHCEPLASAGYVPFCVY